MTQIEKIMSIYYGENRLPYKDEDRQIHYPIVGGDLFIGENNVTTLRFYVNQIGGNQFTWVAVLKMPDGSTAYKPLEEVSEEGYVDLDISNIYTNQVGAVFISLRGYTTDDTLITQEDGVWYVHGNPTVLTTGVVKIMVNYAPQVLGMGGDLTYNQYQLILALLSTKIGYPTEVVRVNELPEQGLDNYIYVVQESDTLHNVYIWNGKTHEYVFIGSNEIDLGAYYTKEEGENFEESVNSRVSIVENQLAGIASGSPAGVYVTVGDLTTANPNHSKIYLVLADNKWYYYDTGTSQWTAGGTYLAGAYDTELDVNSINAVENKAVSKVARKVPTNIYDKEYLIYSWCNNLGPHFNSNALGHMTYYVGYTTCDYICVNVGDRLELTLQTGVTEIKVREYNIGSDGKITSLGNSTTYNANTTITFAKCELIRISVRGNSTPSNTLSQSCVKLYSCRAKEEIFVYPYGKWDYPLEYITTGATISSPLGAGLNGDPYWDTVSKGFDISNVFWQTKTGGYYLSTNLNYIYVKFGLTEPSMLKTLYANKTYENLGYKFGLMPSDLSTGKASSTINLVKGSNGSVIFKDYANDTTSGMSVDVKTLMAFTVDHAIASTNFLVDKTIDYINELFDSLEFRIGLRYDGEKVDLKVNKRGNGFSLKHNGRFPFLSTQTGGQKPSSMSKYGDKLFVLCDNYGVNVIDFNDLTLIATIADNQLGHANNCEFTDEFYDENDIYPLLLVGNGNNAVNQDDNNYSDYLKYIRFANDLSSFTVVKKIVVPVNMNGYYSNCLALDNDNKTLWVFGWKTTSWSSETDNNIFMCSYDLTNLEQHPTLEDTYIPALKTRCEFPFIRGVQDATFCNGYIFFLAASNNAGPIPSEFYIVDTIKQTIRRTVIELFIDFAELETITKVLDEENDKYYLLIGEALFAQYGGVNGTYGHIYRLDVTED